MKCKPITLLLAALLLTGAVSACAANDAKTPLPTVDTSLIDTSAPAETPETDPALVVTTTDSAVPTTSGDPVGTSSIVVTTASDAPSTTSDAPATGAEIVVTTQPDAPVTTSSKPITDKPSVTTKPSVTDKPATTKSPAKTTKPVTTKKPTATAKPPVITAKPATTKAPTTTKSPVTAAPHTHSYGAWTTTKAATCESAGTQQRSCACGAVETKTIAATGHKWGSWTVTKAATTEAEGQEARSCMVCGKKETRTIAKLLSPYDKVAAVGDERLIADRVLYYINQFRAAEGTKIAEKLPKLTLVAEYRSKQLTTNFAHDTDDYRKAFTACKYGKYIEEEETRLDMETFEVIYTGNILKYYEAPVGEAIAGGIGNTIDAVAYSAAKAIHDSSGHWAYVGNSANPYLAVGATYGGTVVNQADGKTYNNMWCVAIFTCSTTEFE